MAKLMLAVVAAALLVACVSASDPSPINDFCVADLKSTFLFNGLACKSPAMVKTEDFLFKGFRMNADTNNSDGIGIIPGFAGVNYPGLNTLGFSLAKINYAKGGLVPPHTHPRATEVLTVLKGEVYMGFVDTAMKLYAATLKKGDFFVFPLGLVHFQLNVGGGHAVTLSVLNAQNPGIQLIAPSLFGSTPFIRDEVLMKGFGLSAKAVGEVKHHFVPSYAA